MELMSRRDRGPSAATAGAPGGNSNQPVTTAASSSTPAHSVPMEVDTTTSAAEESTGGDGEDEELSLPRLSEQLCLDELWSTLGECLSELASTTDHHAVLVLQPAVEAFFMVHAGMEADSVFHGFPCNRFLALIEYCSRVLLSHHNIVFCGIL